MLILLGKTASGKSTVLDALTRHGYKPITTYTSRPRRKKESKKSYHFISKEDFLNKIKEGFFAEWSSYDTVQGKWYYGSAKEDYINADNETVIILNPAGYYSVKTTLDVPYKAIYLYANNNTIRSRLTERGDDKDEADRRILADNKDFKGLEWKVDNIVFNNNDDEIDEVVKKIMGLNDAYKAVTRIKELNNA